MGIWKDKERRDWLYKFQYRGKQYGSRGFKTRREAEAARAKRREEARKEATPIETKAAIGFKAVANEYLDFAQRKFVNDVYVRKVNTYRGFIEANGDLPFDAITPQHVHTYLKRLTSNSLYNERRHELSALFNWVKRVYVREFPYFVNPCIGIEAMPHVTAEKHIPTQEEVLRMIAASTPGDERDILLCCVHTLGRIDEVLRLRWHEDVNFDKRIIVLWTRKRKNGAYEPDAMPMNETLHDILLTRWRKRKQDKWVFYDEVKEGRYKNRVGMMESICRRAGIKPIGTSKWRINKGTDKEKVVDAQLYYGFHSLRHFMASYLFDEKKTSLKTVSGLLRHRNVRTTEIYLHSIDASQLAALGEIEKEFTSKKANLPPTAATKTERGYGVSP
ncbi:MAG: tyrosine-type recombinase/integrase [Smithellaceae bacterium]|nr:tyrosine-type recombinase/integrase [Smithellaceae bacterium]